MMTILRVVTLHKLIKIRALEGACLKREVHVRAEVVDPEILGPGRFACRLFVEEQHIRLHALGVEQARGQAQERVHVTLVQELSADRLPGPPSNRTLSGTTTAARPFCFKRVFTCWMKLSCLLDVVAQKQLNF